MTFLAALLLALDALGRRRPYPEIIRRPIERHGTPLDQSLRLKHPVQVLSIQLGEQRAERHPLLSLIELTGDIDQQTLPGISVFADEPLKSPEVDPAVGDDARSMSDAMPGAPSTW
jgi:hypothetical protein